MPSAQSVPCFAKTNGIYCIVLSRLLLSALQAEVRIANPHQRGDLLFARSLSALLPLDCREAIPTGHSLAF